MGFFVSFGAAFPARIPRPAVLGPGGCSKNPPYPCPRKEKSGIQVLCGNPPVPYTNGIQPPGQEGGEEDFGGVPGQEGKNFIGGKKI